VLGTFGINGKWGEKNIRWKARGGVLASRDGGVDIILRKKMLKFGEDNLRIGTGQLIRTGPQKKIERQSIMSVSYLTIEVIFLGSKGRKDFNSSDNEWLQNGGNLFPT